MYVNTTQAASLLKISPSRLRQLLQKGRVRGAYKTGKYWLIPEGERSLAPDGDAGSHLSMMVCPMLKKPKEDRRGLGKQ